jgi:hypothetical protein
LSLVTKSLLTAGANIEDVKRSATGPVEITLKVSGISKTQLNELIKTIESDNEFSLSIGT